MDYYILFNSVRPIIQLLDGHSIDGFNKFDHEVMEFWIVRSYEKTQEFLWPHAYGNMF